MIKSLGRHPAVIRFGAALLSGYLKFVHLTQRRTFEGLEHAQGVWADRSTGCLVLFWHETIPIAPPAWPRWDKTKAQEIHALISRSADGEFIATVMGALGFPAIRGSRQRQNSVGDKGGAEALRHIIKWAKAGGAVAVTPDGPKGPARVMGEGPVTAARLSGVPVLLLAVASNPCIRIRSWDRTILPLPFSRAAAVYCPPVKVGRDDDLSATARDWTNQLNAATARAEALAA